MRQVRWALGALLVMVALVAACTAPDGGGGTTTTAPTTSSSVPTDPNSVTGAELTWAYNQYAQYGVFGAWSQKVSGPNVVLSQGDGQAISGDPTDAGRPFKQVHFQNGTGTIDRTTGAGTLTWDTGDWVLNAYNGLYGAPDETLRDPILTIAADGSGTLNFEAYIPAGLDINGNPAPAAGPNRIDVATFDNIDELTADGLRTDPDFAGRAYTSPLGSSVDCAGIGGSWPAAWINFVPASVSLHYYTTSCEGLNLKKPPLPFSVTWGTAPVAITQQPTTPAAPVSASADLGLSLYSTGTPVPTIQWQRSFDGITWDDVPGAIGPKYPLPAAATDNGASFRAVLDNHSSPVVVSDVVGPVSVITTAPVITSQPASVSVGVGSPASFSVWATGAPTPTTQWQRSDDGGATWVDISPTTSSPGTSAVNIAVTTLADSAKQYRSLVTNGIGDPAVIVSNIATLTVSAIAPTITSQPVSKTVGRGDPVDLLLVTNGAPKPTVQWQRSDDTGTTWTDITVSTVPLNPNQHRVIPATEQADDGAQFRAVVSNGVGSPAISNVATATVQFDVPIFTAQPRSRATFVGQSTPFTATVAGLPTATLQWETSADGGTSWSNWVPNAAGSSDGKQATLTVASPDLALNGRLFRLKATNAAGETVSSTVQLTVVEVTAARQVLIVPNTPIDPAQPATFEVIGAGFLPAATVNGNMRFAITDTTKWQPGQDGNAIGAVQIATVTKTTLTNAGGFFRRDVTIAANALNPSLSYGVGTFGLTPTEHFYDSWTPITLTTP